MALPEGDAFLTEQADEAAFLWSTRDLALRAAMPAPSVDGAGLAYLDGRIATHLARLVASGRRSVPAIDVVLAEGEPGALFVAAIVALETTDLPRFAAALDAGLARGDAEVGGARELVAALGWATEGTIARVLPGFLHPDCAPDLQRLGVAASAMHRQPIGARLGAAVESPSPELRARAYRAAGALRRVDLAPAIASGIADASTPVALRVVGLVAIGLLGDRAAAAALARLAETLEFSPPGPGRLDDAQVGDRAARMAARLLTPSEGVEWVRKLARAGGARRAVLAFAECGDPAGLPWLLEQMAEPETARLAASVFDLVTGARPPLDVAPDDLDASSSPAEAAERAEVWWRDRAARAPLAKGVRHVLGRPATEADWIVQVLERGPHAAREGAAIELALAHPDQPLFDVHAPSARGLSALRTHHRRGG